MKAISSCLLGISSDLTVTRFYNSVIILKFASTCYWNCNFTLITCYIVYRKTFTAFPPLLIFISYSRQGFYNTLVWFFPPAESNCDRKTSLYLTFGQTWQWHDFYICKIRLPYLLEYIYIYIFISRTKLALAIVETLIRKQEFDRLDPKLD